MSRSCGNGNHEFLFKWLAMRMGGIVHGKADLWEKVLVSCTSLSAFRT